MNIQSKDIENYSIEHSSKAHEILDFIERQTYLKTTQPNMISGFIQGKLIGSFIQMMQAENVLEIGTFTGYTSVWIAENLPESGQLTTIEINKETHWLANRFFEKYEKKDKIRSILGDAKKVISDLDTKWDFVLIDAAKKDNDQYYEMLLPIMNPGGYIAIDNVIWKGKILKAGNDKRSQLIDTFNKKLATDPRVDVCMIPLRDGLSLARKK